MDMHATTAAAHATVQTTMTLTSCMMTNMTLTNRMLTNNKMTMIQINTTTTTTTITQVMLSMGPACHLNTTVMIATMQVTGGALHVMGGPGNPHALQPRPPPVKVCRMVWGGCVAAHGSGVHMVCRRRRRRRSNLAGGMIVGLHGGCAVWVYIVSVLCECAW